MNQMKRNALKASCNCPAAMAGGTQAVGRVCAANASRHKPCSDAGRPRRYCNSFVLRNVISSLLLSLKLKSHAPADR